MINIKRIIKYIIFSSIIVFIILYSLFGNKKKEKEEIIVKEDKPKIIENTEKMVYLINKNNSNVEELLKDNITIKYETVYICEEQKEEIIEEKPILEETTKVDEETKEEIEPVKEEVENLKEEVIEEPQIEESEPIKNGLFEEEGNTYFYENNEKKKGIIDIDGISYYFDDNYKLRNEFTIRDNNVYYGDNKGLHLVDGIRYYFDFNDGHLIRSSIKSVIDISSWQGNIDFEAMKNSNLVDGVIVRVGYGTSINSKCGLDNKFERNISELNRLGIPYGIYIYGYAQNEIAASIEADFVRDMIIKYNVNLYYPVFYDAEIRYYNGVYYSKDMYKRVINTFTSKLDSYGIKNGVYGNLYMLTKGTLSDPSIRSKTIWVAQYYNKCQYDSDYIGWQYSSKGSIPGINGRVDVNIFNY